MYRRALARLEAKTALNLLLDRYQDIVVDTSDPIEFYNSWLITAVKQLPVLVTGRCRAVGAPPPRPGTC